MYDQLIYNPGQRSMFRSGSGFQRCPLPEFVETLWPPATSVSGDGAYFPLHTVGANHRFQVATRIWRASCRFGFQDHMTNLTRGPMRALMQGAAEHHTRADSRIQSDQNEVPGSIAATGIQLRQRRHVHVVV